MSKKPIIEPGPFDLFTPVFKGLYNQADNRPLLKPVDILILADLANWSNVTNNRKRTFRWNYESFDTWAKRLGTSKGPLIKRFRRLTALHLVESIIIEHEGRRYHLKRAIQGNLLKWLNREKYPNWTVYVPPIDPEGNLDWDGGRVPVVFDRSKESEARLERTYTEHFDQRPLTPAKVVKAKVIEDPESVGVVMLKRCAEYCNMQPAEVVETHPKRIESKREAEAKRKARELDNERRNRFKGVKARTLDTCVEVFMILGNQKRKFIPAYRIPENGKDEGEGREVLRLDPTRITSEASAFFHHYESVDWQKKNGQHVDDIYQLADDWLTRRQKRIFERERKAFDLMKADEQREREAKQREAEAREDEANTIDIEYSELD